jgi:hypothetical protein
MFLVGIWSPILLSITLFLAFPFVVCTVIRWICNNAIIGGKHYIFKGSAGGLFVRWIKWYILSIITFGIYSFWATKNQVKWVIENIEQVDFETFKKHQIESIETPPRLPEDELDLAALKLTPMKDKVTGGKTVLLISKGVKVKYHSEISGMYHIETRDMITGYCASKDFEKI